MIRKVIIPAIFITGFLVFSYPFISNWFSVREHASVIGQYNEVLKQMTEDEMESKREQAKKYNESLDETMIPIEDPFSGDVEKGASASYFNVLDIGESMGSIEIPSIDVELPIYHGVSEDVLQRGVGHMSNSSFPIGGLGSHTALTGHRGLPSSKLFTDLDQVKIDDIFYIHTLGETLAYKVDDIRVVLPDELDWLVIDENKDYTTLVTCEPYMINTHRLLVRGERIPYSAEQKVAGPSEAAGDSSKVFGAAVSGALLIILFIGIYFLRKKKESGAIEKK